MQRQSRQIEALALAQATVLELVVARAIMLRLKDAPLQIRTTGVTEISIRGKSFSQPNGEFPHLQPHCPILGAFLHTDTPKLLHTHPILAQCWEIDTRSLPSFTEHYSVMESDQRSQSKLTLALQSLQTFPKISKRIYLHLSPHSFGETERPRGIQRRSLSWLKQRPASYSSLKCSRIGR